MKHPVSSYLFALLLATLPLETLVGATETANAKTISIGGTEYAESGTCANNACVNFDSSVANITLSGYNGGAILVEGYDTVNIFNPSGTSRITTNGEYGIKTDARKLNFPCVDSYYCGDTGIIVNSSTDRANGILMTNGSVEIDKFQQFHISVNSTVPSNVITTDTVTGITTPLGEEVIVSVASPVYIYNPTGNYGIYTGKYTANAQKVDGELVGFNMFGTIRHKITDGVGDAFCYNDFEESEIPDDPKVDAPRELVTFTHNIWPNSGEFKFAPIFGGASANFDTELTSGETYQSANERIRNSVAKEEDSSIYSPYNRYHPMPFELGDGAHLVIVDDLNDGTYHEVEDPETSTIEAGEKYALYIPFWLWETEWNAISKINSQNYALLNREETNSNVFYIDSGHAYILAPLNLDGQPIEYTTLTTMTFGYGSITASEPEAQSSTPTIPKAPNTGRGR